MKKKSYQYVFKMCLPRKITHGEFSEFLSLSEKKKLHISKEYKLGQLPIFNFKNIIYVHIPSYQRDIQFTLR